MTDLCGFVCEYLASTAARIALNKFRIRMVSRRCVYADECLDMVSCRRQPDIIHSETVDFQLLSSNYWFVCWLVQFFLWAWISFRLYFFDWFRLDKKQAISRVSKCLFSFFVNPGRSFIAHVNVNECMLFCVSIKLIGDFRMIRLREMVRCICSPKRVLTVSNDQIQPQKRGRITR